MSRAAVLVGEAGRRLGGGDAHRLLALAGEVVEVGPRAGPLDVHLGERVAQHVPLAPPLLEAVLPALDLGAGLAHALLGGGGPALGLVALEERLRQEALDLGDLGRELAPADGGLGGVGPGGADPLVELREVPLEAPPLVLGGGDPLAQRGERAHGLGVARLRRLGGGARPGQGGRHLGEAAVALFALSLGGAEGLLDLGEPDLGGAPLLLRLRALRVEDASLAVEPSRLVLGGLDLVAHRHQVLLGGVDALLERARLRGGRGGQGVGLGGGGAEGGEATLHLLLPRRDLLHLPARGEEALDVAPALDERPAERLALEGHHRDRALPRGHLEGVLEGGDDDRVGERRADALRVGAAHAVEVGEEAEGLLLLGGDLAERAAVVTGARGGEGQEGPPPRARGLEPADAAPGLLGVGHEHRLQPVAEEGLHRALVLGAGLERVGHDAEHLEALRAVEEGAHPLVEGGVGGDHLLERGEAAGEAVPLALQRVRLAPEPLGPATGLVLARGRGATGPFELRREGLGLAPAGAGGLADGAHPGPLALELLDLPGELQQVGRRALGVPRHRRARVLERGDPPEQPHLGLAPALLAGLGFRLPGGGLRHRGLRRAELPLRRGEVVVQLLLRRALPGQGLGERRHAGDELLLLARRLLRPALVLRELLPAVAAAALVAVHGEGQVVEPPAHLLEPRLQLVERLPPHLELRLLGLEGDRRRPLAPGLGAVPLLEDPGALHQVEESAAEEHALDPLHLLLDRAPPPRLRRLALEALELLLDLVDDVVHAEEVLLGRLQLELGLPTARLVLRDARRLLDDRAAVGGLRREDLADLALLDDRVRLRAEPGVHEQLVDVAQATDPAVHQVLALPVPVEPPRHHALGAAVGAVAVEAGDLEVHLGHLQRLPARAAVEDHVLHRRAAQALHALLAEHPVDGVGDVALAAAVRAHDAGDAALEGELLPVAEALESDDLHRVQTHRAQDRTSFVPKRPIARAPTPFRPCATTCDRRAPFGVALDVVQPREHSTRRRGA